MDVKISSKTLCFTNSGLESMCPKRNHGTTVNFQLINENEPGTKAILAEMGVMIFCIDAGIHKSALLDLSAKTRNAILGCIRASGGSQEDILCAIITHLHSWTKGKGYAKLLVQNASDLVHMVCGEEPDYVVVNDFKPYLMDDRLYTIKDIADRKAIMRHVLSLGEYYRQSREAEKLFLRSGYIPEDLLGNGEPIYVFQRTEEKTK